MKKTKLDKVFLHRLFLLFIILILPTFLIREYWLIKAKKDNRILPAQDFFQSQLIEKKNKPFTFIVLTKNNSDSIEENFHSLLEQKYSNYQIIYIDRGSTDGTVEKIQALIETKDSSRSITLFSFSKEHKAFQAYFDIVGQLDDDEIIVHLCGNDFLAHPQVLNRLDQVYTNPDVWLTYGQNLDYNYYQKGIYRPKPKKTLCKKRIQRAPWLLASFKTFYAKHFKKIKREEEIETYLLSVENEIAFLLPLAELGKSHIQFIPDVLSIHNGSSQKNKKKIPFNEFSKRLSFLIQETFPKNEKRVDLILFSDNRPERLDLCLKSIKTQVKGIGDISVIYWSDKYHLFSYQKMIHRYPKIIFMTPFREKGLDFKTLFMNALIGNANSSPYILLSSDQIIVTEEISLPICIRAMQKFRAYGFYFHLGQEKKNNCLEEMYSWFIGQGQKELREPNTLKMTLYRKVDLERDFKYQQFDSPEELIMLWARQLSLPHFGLSFNISKIRLAPNIEQPPEKQNLMKKIWD